MKSLHHPRDPADEDSGGYLFVRPILLSEICLRLIHLLPGRIRRCCVAAFALLPLLLVQPTLAAQNQPVTPATALPPALPTVLPTLTTAKAAHELPLKEALRHYPVRIDAVVTYYDAVIDTRHPALFVTDASGSIFVVLKSFPAVPLKAGQQVEITGVSGNGDYAPIVTQATARVTGESHLPTAAPRVNMLDLLTDNRDGQWVEVEGVVHSVTKSGGNVFLDLALRDGHLSVGSVIQPGVDYKHLIDSKILVRGNEAPLFNSKIQLVGAHIFFPDISTVTVEEAGPADPFQLPIDDVGSLMSYTPNAAFKHRVHLRGVVTLFWPGRMLCLQQGSGGICAQTSQSSPLNPGELADVIGFPLIGEFTPTLSQATYKAAGGSQPVSPVAITPAQALKGDFDARPVQMEGQIIGVDRADDDPTLILTSGNFIFTAVLPDRSQAAALAKIEEGSWVRITGICAVRSDATETATSVGFSIAKSFRILMASPGDVVTVHKPSWWNARHTLGVLALALLLAIFALARATILSHRVRQQTAVIRAQLAETANLKEAAEFQATHDGLTGVRNRRAIFDMLHREFELAARTGSTTGIMMLDLDHFKKVNDTYGHSAGDEVLRESVRRILQSVRSTDLVGRYGGEEFLIVLPQCDEEQLKLCGERVREAIASRPILAEGHSLNMTASVGATVAISSPAPEDSALKIADAALYRAKHSGRNRVVMMDPELTELPGSLTAPEIEITHPSRFP